ncbi:MAG: carbon monoxide dehydrogenase accessory protein CooC [bacterium]|nr:carbon monoxide dehydrogenase accessory protein CooC [bacterium]
MKIAVSGKGGVGKTTLAAILCLELSRRGLKVLAVDADPVAGLGAALGFPDPEKIKPISEMKDLIAERTGAKPGSIGGYFRLNPRVDDIPENFCREQNGIRLVVMGTVKAGGAGCICPESALLRALLQHLILERDEAVIVDMEAGVEHLGRATAGSVDRMLVVVEPGQRSLAAARMIRKLAADIGLSRIGIVANKVRGESDLAVIKNSLPEFELLGWLPLNTAVIEADLAGRPVSLDLPGFREQVGSIMDKLGK